MKRFVVNLSLDISGLVYGETVDDVRRAVNGMIWDNPERDDYIMPDDFDIDVRQVEVGDSVPDDEVCFDEQCENWQSKVKKGDCWVKLVHKDDED